MGRFAGRFSGRFKGRFSHVSLGSLASQALAAETQGLAIDLTDNYFYQSTGRYGSAKVKDTGTPANNFDSIPGDLLTYTGTTKLTRQSDGVYRYGPHNLYVNSATPANQSITVVSGASYSVTITGSVSVTASGAATGTWTAGTTTFTAATATLTLGSTSGSGTVHIRRTPSDSTYLPTTSSARYGLPFEWNTSGVLQGILVEPQATNLFLNNTTGATQTITVSNATVYTVSFFGTGSITFSGANSSTLNGTGATNRVSTTFTTSSTSLTCTVSGSITNVQVETGSVATSPIITYAASATRAADSINLASALFPSIAAEFSVVAEIVFEQIASAFGSVAVATNLGGAFTLGSGSLLRISSDTTTDAGGFSTAATKIISPSLGSGTALKLGAAYRDANNKCAITNRGQAVATITTLDWTGTHNRLQLGALNGSGTQALNGYLRKLVLTPRYDEAWIIAGTS